MKEILNHDYNWKESWVGKNLSDSSQFYYFFQQNKRENVDLCIWTIIDIKSTIRGQQVRHNLCLNEIINDTFLCFNWRKVDLEPSCQCRRHNGHGWNPWVRKIPWRRAWQPNPVFLPGESHGQRSLAGYSPWGHRESDIIEATYHACTCVLSTKIRVFFFSLLMVCL